MRHVVLASLICVLVPQFSMAQANVSGEQPFQEQAAELRKALLPLMVTPSPTKGQYETYFEAFPRTFIELKEVLASHDESGYLEILGKSLPIDRSIPPRYAIPAPYVQHMCKAYEYVGRKRYVEKLVRIGVSAGGWGEPKKGSQGELIYPADDVYSAGGTFVHLLYGTACYHPAGSEVEKHFAERRELVIAVANQLNDTQIEALYASLSWDALEGSGREWWSAEWFLDGVCQEYPDRCGVVQMLRNKYKHLESTKIH